MRMFRELVLMSSVAIAAAVFPALAQQGPQGYGMGPYGMGPYGMQGMMGQGMMMGWGMQGMMMNPAVMGMMMGGPAVQGRLAYVKAELGITDAQTAAWDGYASAVNARVASMQGIHADMIQAMQTGNAMARLDAHINAMEAMVDSLKALKPATAALYAVLTDEQKQKADLLLVTGVMM